MFGGGVGIDSCETKLKHKGKFLFFFFRNKEKILLSRIDSYIDIDSLNN